MTDPIENRIGAHCTKKEQQALYYELLPELPLFVMPPHRFYASGTRCLWSAQCGLCSICGHPLNPTKKSVEATNRIRNWLRTTREHVWPIALGYSDANNILLAHALCNVTKGSSEPTADQLKLLKKVYG